MKCASQLFAVAAISCGVLAGCAEKSASKESRTAANANDMSGGPASTITADGTAAYPTTDSTMPQSAPVYAPAPTTGTSTASSGTTAATHTMELSPPVPSTAGRTDVAPSAAAGAAVPPNGSSGALTPMDQGGSEADRRVTQKVRQAVVADGSLSFAAKNVKIITIDGNVTLRGAVKSGQERSSIEQKAKTTAGVKAVDNQLEVKQ